MAVDAEFAESLTVRPLYARLREQRVRLAGNHMKLTVAFGARSLSARHWAAPAAIAGMANTLEAQNV